MKRLSILFGLLLPLLTGCSPFQLVNSEVYNHADLAAYKTYRIASPDEGKLPPGMSMIDYYNITNAIRQQMTLRGYQESPSAVLLVNFGLTTRTQVNTAPIWATGVYPFNGYYPYFIYPRAYYWPPYYTNTQVVTGIYKEGVLTMDMANLEEKMYLYSASVSTVLEPGSGALRNLNELEKAAQVLFSKFPVKPLNAKK